MVTQRTLTMKNRTIILIIANLILVAYIFFNLQEEKKTALNFETSVFTTLSNLNALEFTFPSQNKFLALQKNQSGDWHLSTPVSWPAEPLGLSNFLTSLSHLDAKFLVFTTELERRGELLTDYGFDENSSFFVLKGKENNLKFKLGKITRDENFVYLLTGDDNEHAEGIIWKASSGIIKWAERELADWALPHFIHFPLYAMDEISTSSSDESYSKQTKLVRINNDWTFTLPFSAKVNTEKINFLLNQLISEKILGFYSEPLSSPLPTPIIELTIQALGKVQKIQFFEQNSSETSLLLARSDSHELTFLVTSDIIDTLSDWPKKLRERRLFSLEPDNLSRIKITSINSSLSLRQNDLKSWMGLEDNGTDSLSFDAENSSIVELFNKLNALEVTDFMIFNPTPSELTANGFSNPDYRLEIDYMDSTRQNLLFSRSNDQSSYLKAFVSEQALICLVNEHCEELLNTKSLQYRKKSLFPLGFKPDRIIFKSLKKAVDPSILAINSGGESFERLMDFKAKNYINSQPNEDGTWVDGNWVPWCFSLKFEKMLDDSKQSIEFLLSDRIGGSTWYAGLIDEQIVCTLPIHLIDELTTIHPSPREKDL